MLPRLRYRADPGNISRIKNLLEGYDNVAVISIVNGRGGLFDILFLEGMEEEVRKVMDGLMGEIEMEETRDT